MGFIVSGVEELDIPGDVRMLPLSDSRGIQQPVRTQTSSFVWQPLCFRQSAMVADFSVKVSGLNRHIVPCTVSHPLALMLHMECQAWEVRNIELST